MEFMREKVVRRPSISVRIGRTASAPINQSRLIQIHTLTLPASVITSFIYFIYNDSLLQFHFEFRIFSRVFEGICFRLKNVGQPSPPVRAQRRESFLYRQQVSFTPDREEEEQIVTPFAQILATLKEVRNNLSFFLARSAAGGERGRRSNLHKSGSMLCLHVTCYRTEIMFALELIDKNCC